MGFLSPWYLLGALGVGLPVYLHLLRRHKAEPLRFASLMFFEPRTQSSMQHARLRYLLLMAMRIALLALLALAFASPYIRRPAGAGTGHKLHIVAVDRSFSMRAAGRLESAREQAAGALSRVPEGDAAQVLALDSGVEMLTQATSDRDRRREAVRSIQAGDGRGAYAELARAVKSIASGRTEPIELDFFSDLQRSGMPPGFADLQLPPNVTLRVHPVARNGAEPNWFVESVNAPHIVYSARKVTIRAVVAGAGTAAARRQATLLLNGRTIESRAVDVPAAGRAEVEFAPVDVPFGENRGEVRIDPADVLAADDHFRFALERAEPRRILFVQATRDSGGAMYFRAALEATPDPAFTLESRGAAETAGIAPAPYALVVLSDCGILPQTFETNLANYVRGGGALWIAAGPSAAGLPRLPVAGYRVDGSRYYARSAGRFETVADADPEHPSLKNAGRWDAVKFFQVAHVEPGDGARVAARLADSTPVLADQRVGEGRVLVFASAFDNLSNDFPLHASFVPFVQQTARYLAGIEESPGEVPVAAFLELRHASAKATTVDVLGPDGKSVLGIEEAARATTFQPRREGFYEIRRAGSRNQTVAVNADRQESDLEPIPAETLALWQRSGSGAGAAPATAAEVGQTAPRSVWWYVLLAVLVLALVESVFAARYLTFERDGEEV